ncbi:galactitol-1-phosphate 5-dehydrogenase [Subtercola sp. PAMC28395]|uniref:galactitol-1-phosphate 5-dehydrogenase n=1 Tax=Subtercola sp. PAMC28395 TaxID=2846775 RepID=UPI001C0D1A9E|nr:galactitol-1-phosphate 5-dehydrogenase [Subtercola sp. PAMC28395]QWT22700.1 galactitol-1-phosphate 5-dehydrogenase [Subtercola sp. PAMC28395]
MTDELLSTHLSNAPLAGEMTAGVLHDVGDVRIEQVPIPTPGPGDLLVKVAACGVCGSDIPRMNFSAPYRLPLICGHEFSGHVVFAADDVTGFTVGDLVSVPPLLPCRKCESCLEGHFSLCEDYDYFGSRRDGAYAQYVVVPADNALIMPEGLDPRAAAMIDPAAIALHAIWRTRLTAGSRVAVIGAGPIGLFAVQWARLLGATDVLAVDVNEQKADMAREAGATHTATNDEEALAHAGKGYDVIIESAGVPQTIALAVKLAARHGEAAFIGIPHRPVELDKAAFSGFLRNEVSLYGSWNSFSAPFPGKEWTESAAKLSTGDLKWQFMITHELGLDALPETMKQLADRSIFSSKVLFFPNAG